MDLNLARALVGALGLYLALGVVFAIPFVARGVRRLDPEAGAGTAGFRLIIAPGVVAFWPLLALRLLRDAGPPEERNAHRQRARP